MTSLFGAICVGALSRPRQVLPLIVLIMSLHYSDENIVTVPGLSSQDAREYCSMESFNATCPGQNEVIVMETARFGRMRTGRCIRGEYGVLGCHRDAMWFLERKCSGRTKCKVPVSDQNLVKLNPCSQPELTSYLEAKYYCVTVASGATGTCRHNKQILLSNGFGYISSEYAIASGIGTSECSFKIQVNPGQRIQLTLIVFTGKRIPEEADESPIYHTDSCFEIGSISSSPGQSKTLTACNGNTRGLSNVLHLSDGSNLTVQLHSKYILKDLSPFVIKYESYGCQVLAPPAGGWVKMTRDIALIGCNGSEQEMWTVTCSGTRWTGNIGNCTVPVSLFGASAATQLDDAFPYGILVVVAIGVALGVFIGGTLLTIVAFCMRRTSREESALAGDCLSAEMIDDTYVRSDTIIPDLRCTINEDRRYRLNPGSFATGYPLSATEQGEILTTSYDDQDLILCRTGNKAFGCTTGMSAHLQPLTTTTTTAITGQRSLHLYETPQFG